MSSNVHIQQHPKVKGDVTQVQVFYSPHIKGWFWYLKTYSGPETNEVGPFDTMQQTFNNVQTYLKGKSNES
jgi:hypothetical protein